MTTPPICPYCGNGAKLAKGDVVYGGRADLASLWFWRCVPCSAWVGTHRGTKEPLGRLANGELRTAKRRAHWAFDSLWQKGSMSRGQAYKWLAEELGLDVEECHIGEFNLARCHQVIQVCTARKFATVVPTMGIHKDGSSHRPKAGKTGHTKKAGTGHTKKAVTGHLKKAPRAPRKR